MPHERDQQRDIQKRKAKYTELKGYWETRSGTYVLRCKVGYDNKSWTARFEKPNDHSDFPIKASFS